MKNLKIKNIYQIVAIIIFIIGLVFTVIFAEIDDATGFIFIGTAINAFFCLLLFGFGELIDMIKNMNNTLIDIFKNIKKK